jgi:hypothetical protein
LAVHGGATGARVLPGCKWCLAAASALRESKEAGHESHRGVVRQLRRLGMLCQGWPGPFNVWHGPLRVRAHFRAMTREAAMCRFAPKKRARDIGKVGGAVYELVVFGTMALLVLLGGLALFGRSDRWWVALRWVSHTVWVAGATALVALIVVYTVWYLSGIGRP